MFVKLCGGLARLLMFGALVGCSASARDASSPTAAVITAASTAQSRAAPAVPSASGTTPALSATSATSALVTPTATRAPVATVTTAPTAVPSATAVPATPAYSYPIGLPGKPPGDGFYIRDAYVVENTWYNPGWWHTAEDWYALEGSTVGAQGFAVADGNVVYAGANYPGRVVIVQHADGLFSMYGHLDPKLAVTSGQRVTRGQVIGTVGPGWDRAPGHLHFEIRTFLTQREVNGAAPRYGYRCGVNCPPGPGYWPIRAPDHPSEIGWHNPTHTIARRAFAGAAGGSLGEVMVATSPVSSSITLWSAAPGEATPPQAVAEVALRSGDHFPLLDIRAGAENPRATSAQGYALWYRIRLPEGAEGWVQAAVPSTRETGSDGRPASVLFNFVPAIPTAP